MKLFAVWNKNHAPSKQQVFVVGNDLETDIDQNFSAPGFTAGQVETVPVFSNVADFEGYHTAIKALETLQGLSKFEIARFNEYFGIDKIVETEMAVAQIRKGFEEVDGGRLTGAMVYPVYRMHETDHSNDQTVLGVFTSAAAAQKAQKMLSDAKDWSSPDGSTKHGTSIATVFTSVAKAVLGDQAPDPATAVASRFTPEQRAFLKFKLGS